MLQHSRTSSGVKEPTDINALADEYLRLSYHGLACKRQDHSMQNLKRILIQLYQNSMLFHRILGEWFST
jgi:hypothetical protein